MIPQMYANAGMKLPPFEELNAEFDLLELPPETKRIVKETAKRVFERLNGFRTVLETTLQPERVLEMQEMEFLTDADRTEVSAILRHLMRLDRTMLQAELENTDQAYAMFINAAWEEWPQLKKRTMPIVRKLQQGWEKPSSAKSVLHYLG